MIAGDQRKSLWGVISAVFYYFVIGLVRRYKRTIDALVEARAVLLPLKVSRVEAKL